MSEPRPQSLTPVVASTNACEARCIIGQSPAIQRLRHLLSRLQRSAGSVIVTGEPGAGKELVARALRQPGAPFVTVDAATIASSTAESALFGHARGAFTGAHTARAGLLEQAHGGMLYVDEVANMALDVQAKLLRALQEKEVTPLGGTHTRRLDFRVVCATNQDLDALCRDGLFRFDLYSRLAVFSVTVPPLRARREDIPALFAFFCRSQSPESRIDPAVWPILAAYHWPGNVRELSNAAQYAAAMGDGPIVLPEHLPDRVRLAGALGPQDMVAVAAALPWDVVPAPIASSPAPVPILARGRQGLNAQVQAFEATILRQAYGQAGGNVSQMARDLSVDRSCLHNKLQRLGIHSVRRAKGGHESLHRRKDAVQTLPL
jgi:DNA-binding NtrC family response regulator